MKGKIPHVLRAVVLELLKTICTTIIVWLLCLLLGISFLLSRLGPFISEVAAGTLVGLPMGIQIP